MGFNPTVPASRSSGNQRHNRAMIPRRRLKPHNARSVHRPSGWVRNCKKNARVRLYRRSPELGTGTGRGPGGNALRAGAAAASGWCIATISALAALGPWHT